MSADPFLYCLQHLTDYRQFERLASDLMAGSDYPDIEPIGGTGDGGRDALHVSRATGTVTVFAYSVRSDWDTKLRQDCVRISELDESPNRIVFVSTQSIGATQKDAMRAETQRKYGWSIEFYDNERIRVMLVGPLKSIVGQHPAIFCSPWFERRGGVLVTQEQHDLVVIDHVPADHALATWLFRKLTAAGYDAWCYGAAPLAGENADQSVRTLIQQRAARYLPILSAASLDDPNFRGRWAVSLITEGQTLPCQASDLETESLDAQMSQLERIPFDRGWAAGLAALLKHLELAGIVQPIDPAVGHRIALNAYMTEPLLREEPETVYANVFKAEVPDTILLHELDHAKAPLEPALRRRWAFARRGKLLFSFAPPPDDIKLQRPNPSAYDWRRNSERFGISSENLVKELLRKSLLVACHQCGFEWCELRYSFFLDEPPRTRHGYQHVDGQFTNVSFCGERSWGMGERKHKFRYQLGPTFRVTIDESGVIWVTMRFYVRVTDHAGTPLDKKLIPSRRKRVTKSWWNRQWLQRTVGVMQFIAGTGSDIKAKIMVGEGKHQVTVNVAPLMWECPVSIDVEALDRVGDFQEEMSEVGFEVQMDQKSL